MKHLHLPPFFVACGDGVIVAREVTANQMQNAGAAILVFKDLADQADCSGRSLEPALHGALLCKLKFVYAYKTLFIPALLTQRHQPVVFQGRYEMLAPARGEIKVLLGGPLCQTKPYLESQCCVFRRL